MKLLCPVKEFSDVDAMNIVNSIEALFEPLSPSQDNQVENSFFVVIYPKFRVSGTKASAGKVHQIT